MTGQATGTTDGTSQSGWRDRTAGERDLPSLKLRKCWHHLCDNSDNNNNNNNNNNNSSSSSSSSNNKISYFYLRQVNKVNGGDNVFVQCVCVYVCVCARSGPVNQTSLKWTLNANSSKTVKATDFKFDIRSQGQSGYDP